MPQVPLMHLIVAIVAGAVVHIFLGPGLSAIFGIGIVLLYIFAPATIGSLFNYQGALISAGYIFAALLFAAGFADVMIPMVPGEGINWINFIVFATSYIVLIFYVWPNFIARNGGGNDNDDQS